MVENQIDSSARPAEKQAPTFDASELWTSLNQTANAKPDRLPSPMVNLDLLPGNGLFFNPLPQLKALWNKAEDRAGESDGKGAAPEKPLVMPPIAKPRVLDGGGSPGTYEPDPDNPRRPDDQGGPYNEPGSDDQRRPDDEGGPFNEPGSDGGPYLRPRVKPGESTEKK